MELLGDIVNYSTLKDGACAKGINPFARLID